MSQLDLTFPDSTYSTSNKPAVATLKADLAAIETAHNDLDTNAVTATSTTVMTNKTLTAPVITTPTIKTYDGWQLVSDTWTYASADAPTFTITVPTGAASLYGVGMRIKLNQTTDKYFIITAVADTVLTVYGGTDYTLANAAISSIYVSLMKAPLGFPLDPTKWTVITTDVSARSQAAPTVNVWYNLGSMSQTIPIGVWLTSYQVYLYANDNTGTILIDQGVTFSTANNSESDTDFTAQSYMYVNSAVAGSHGTTFHRSKTLVLAAKTQYYLNARAIQTAPSGSFTFGNDYSKMVIRSICAYL